MSEIIPLLNKAPSSNREVYLPTRGGGPVKSRGNVDFFTDLKKASEGSPKEPGPYGEPRQPQEALQGPREAPSARDYGGQTSAPRAGIGGDFTGYHSSGMTGEGFAVFGDPTRGYFYKSANPEADPVGPFPTSKAAYEACNAGGM